MPSMNPGSDAIDQESFKRYQPGFQGDEYENVIWTASNETCRLSLYRFGEESPGVLQVCDGHHREDAGHELDPTIGNTRGVNQSETEIQP